MHIAIVMPVVLQNDALLQMTLDCVGYLRTRHRATLYVVSNRLHVLPPEELQRALEGRFAGEVRLLHEPGVERSVAGAWNHGCVRALEERVDYLAIVANDTQLHDDCLDVLVDHGETGTCDLWSGVSGGSRDGIESAGITDGADFSCFMFRPRTLEQHGFFDPHFRPAYFEDNDYYARVVLGGGDCRMVHAARFVHHGSMTIRHDPEMAHHVRYWFEKNRAYFRDKWGVGEPENSREGVWQRYYHHPFNDPARPLVWFPPESA